MSRPSILSVISHIVFFPVHTSERFTPNLEANQIDAS